DDNLSFVRDRLLRSGADLASLLDLYGKVRASQPVRPDDTNPLIDLLRLSGVTRVEESPSLAPSLPRSLTPPRLTVRNRIYERVFDREWVAQHMPDAEVRRQRAAFRGGVVRATAVAAAIVVMMALLMF